MKRVNVTISDDAKRILVAYQNEGEYSNLDYTLDSLIKEFELSKREGKQEKSET